MLLFSVSLRQLTAKQKALYNLRWKWSHFSGLAGANVVMLMQQDLCIGGNFQDPIVRICQN